MKKPIFLAIVLVVILGVSYWMYADSKKPGQYDNLAQCLQNKGVKFYGAFWCPHCQNQKAMFGKSAKKLPYIECSTPDGKGQTQVCKDAKIEGYPTWEFTDGTRMSTEIKPEVLAEKTSCPLN